MKTVKIIALLMFILTSQIHYGQKQEVDVEKSNIEWSGKRLGTKHYGNIKLKSGNLILIDDDIAGGKFVVDMKTITNTDLNKKADNDKLVNHLKSDDFFGVEKYPIAKLVIIETTKFVNDKAILKGKITIKDKTEYISFDIVKEGSAYKTKIEIDRSKFDVRYGSNTFFDNLGDTAISDIFTLKINIEPE